MFYREESKHPGIGDLYQEQIDFQLLHQEHRCI